MKQGRVFVMVLVGVVLCGTLGLRAQGGGQGGPPPAPPKPGQLAPDYFKNIKVLKKVPADQLRTQMEYFTASLGVQCNFCHVQGQFDSDENPRKDRARKMMAMVDRFNDSPANDITVTCATCHHGHVPPERTPTLAVVMTQAEADAAAAARAARGGGPGGPGRGAPGGAPGAPGGQGRGPGGPGGPGGRGQQPPPKPTETTDQVVDKYVQALGGQAALAQAKTRVLEGSQQTRDLQTQPIRIQEKATGEYRMDIATTPNPQVRVSTAAGAWTTGQGPNPRDLEGVQAAQISRATDFGLAQELKRKAKNFEVQRYENIDGKPAITISGKRNDLVTETLSFDRESGLLLRRAIQTKTAYGALAEQVDYGDYKDVSGVKIPFQVKYTTWNQVSTQKIADAKVNVSIDDAAFTKK